MTDGPRSWKITEDSILFFVCTRTHGPPPLIEAVGFINARKSVSIGSGNYDAVAVRDTLYYGVAIVLAKSPGMKL